MFHIGTRPSSSYLIYTTMSLRRYFILAYCSSALFTASNVGANASRTLPGSLIPAFTALATTLSTYFCVPLKKPAILRALAAFCSGVCAPPSVPCGVGRTADQNCRRNSQAAL